MDVLDPKASFGGGGAGRGGGGFYHLSFRSGSRAGGASAHSAYEYATREGEYGDADLDPAVYTESGNMPSWAQEDVSDDVQDINLPSFYVHDGPSLLPPGL